MFRRLRADEIECRVQSIKEKGLVLLLYKDARADMRLLDETVGPLNWKKSYSRDNSNCTVSIWDSKKSQWISKEDTGTESNTEAEKGKASDSFKRACFNWGIGRELYTAPFMWIKSNDYKLSNGKCYDKFTVTSIECDNNGNISRLQIKNENLSRIVYNWQQQTEPVIELTQELATADDKRRLIAVSNALNVDISEINKEVGVNGKMTKEQLGFAFKILKDIEEGKR